MADEFPLSIRFAKLERSIVRISGLLARFLPSITFGDFDVNGFTDTIEQQRTKECEVKVEVTIEYDPKSEQVTTDEDGEVTRRCTTFEITTTVKVTETCRTEEGVTTEDKGSASHVSSKEFCDEDGDITQAKTGRTTGFDGKLTETLTYPHGVKVTVHTKDGKTTVTVSFPDGTGSSLTIEDE